mmetsp:Transcript_8460/g.21718  ORF Transcript_8460/g.21718 Transcript_8460/m.21718 type:complete len:369 (+) Transcript_8460:700-1806(+)
MHQQRGKCVGGGVELLRHGQRAHLPVATPHRLDLAKLRAKKRLAEAGERVAPQRGHPPTRHLVHKLHHCRGLHPVVDLHLVCVAARPDASEENLLAGEHVPQRGCHSGVLHVQQQADELAAALRRRLLRKRALFARRRVGPGEAQLQQRRGARGHPPCKRRPPLDVEAAGEGCTAQQLPAAALHLWRAVRIDDAPLEAQRGSIGLLAAAAPRRLGAERLRQAPGARRRCAGGLRGAWRVCLWGRQGGLTAAAGIRRLRCPEPSSRLAGIGCHLAPCSLRGRCVVTAPSQPLRPIFSAILPSRSCVRPTARWCGGAGRLLPPVCVPLRLLGRGTQARFLPRERQSHRALQVPAQRRPRAPHPLRLDARA